MFDPKTNKFPYPEDTDQHYLKLKKDDGTVFDKNYPYIDRSASFRIRRFFFRIAVVAAAFPVSAVRMGLRIRGRENLKKYKDVLKKGVISCSNHVHMWDYISIMHAVWPYRTHVLSWAPDISGENGRLIRLSGGIPIPEHDLHATGAYIKAVRQLLEEGGWLQIYAEGSMWEYYAPIRPFKRGAAYLACKLNKPILPLAYSYRKAGRIRRRLFHQPACFTLTIGEPLYPDRSLPKEEMERDLLIRSHEAVCRLAGIEPKDNIYPPVFDHSKRIDYYTDTYGIGYKGSW